MSTHLRALFLLTLFLLLSDAVDDFSTSEHTCPNRDALKTKPLSAHRYIVRFVQYQEAVYWKQELTKWLDAPFYQWSWIDRANPASAFPTDFGVITLNEQTGEIIQERIKSADFVKDIHPDRVIHRNLFTSEDWVQEDGTVQKPPGRLQTRWTIGLEKDDDYSYGDDIRSEDEFKRRSLLLRRPSVTNKCNAEAIWNLGYKGQKVRVGVFDTGIRRNHEHVKNIIERTNWTQQDTRSDGLGHGSFVAGVIAGSDAQCPGFAPEVDLHTFKVFTDDQVSYTSWFMDAFNYAIMTKMHIVNLSIGGPDFLDHPFVEKVLDVTSSGIIMVSAIGNDGPYFGTLNNPADQNDVIGIGGIDFNDAIARFSSRGMSTWELPTGYGRIKPDVLAYSQDVSGSRMTNGCRHLSGTSVASPVAAGATALLASTVPEDHRWEIINPASMKQALVEGATRLNNVEIYVQGAGKINLQRSMQILQQYKPRASLIPGNLNLTDCPYMWPFCRQPLYANAAPVVINATILNGLAVTGMISEEPVFTPSDEGGNLISVEFEYSDVLWPWSGYLAIYIRVKSAGKDFSGRASGSIRFTVKSDPRKGQEVGLSSSVEVPFEAAIIPTPERKKRILWDQFHSIKYPPAYIPRDNLGTSRDILDWHGDHPHTNFHELFDFLIEQGYYMEILGSPFTCFNAEQYGALLVVDSEDVFYPDEIEKLTNDVQNKGLGLIVFAEWYNAKLTASYRFYDDNTRSWWIPATGGGNIPGLNELLNRFGIAFGDAVLTGRIKMTSDYSQNYLSGANIARFPSEGYLHEYRLENSAIEATPHTSYPVFGLTDAAKGRVAVYGDSNCLDSNFQMGDCYSLLKAMMDYVNHEEPRQLLDHLLNVEYKLLMPYTSMNQLPEMIENIRFEDVSFVLSNPHQCYKNSPHGEGVPDPYVDNKPEPEQPESKQDAGRNVNEVITTIEEHPNKASPENTESTDKTIPQKEKDNLSVKSEIAWRGIIQPGSVQGVSEWTPPVAVTKWTALLGLVTIFLLYRVARRRHQFRQQESRR